MKLSILIYKFFLLLLFILILINKNNFLFQIENNVLAKPLLNNFSSLIPIKNFNNKKLIYINAKSYILVDTNSGNIITEFNSEKKIFPASLTKLMTLYIIFHAIKNKEINLCNQIKISHKSWSTKGSSMFLKEGQKVSIKNLLQGIIVNSGNDACVAIAEYLNGNETNFANIMNQQAKKLGMINTHFTNSTGLHDQKLYSTAKDIAILSRALINNFYQYYKWYKKKSFTFNGIKQFNRNNLLWKKTSYVDGIKTGYTKESKYCLASSAQHNNMRLLVIIIGSPNNKSRFQDSEYLFHYGFQFFKTFLIYKKKKTIAKIPIYNGQTAFIPIGINNNQFITLYKQNHKPINIVFKIINNLQAPIRKGKKIGELIISTNEFKTTQPLYTLTNIKKGNYLTCIKDYIILKLKKHIYKNQYNYIYKKITLNN
ncbi:D-alanyl-D-alanine carboxypeptidase family protein [Candidatus Legionella polyplacis]|uniref:serine-type D-Ala-D-Ala carboxypeptidase n=1 Tax=Candidatus Legionella polyplacis TaxID=2005262 RepID=A0ABZ2GYZ8_9GAMM